MIEVGDLVKIKDIYKFAPWYHDKPMKVECFNYFDSTEVHVEDSFGLDIDDNILIDVVCNYNEILRKKKIDSL